MDPHTKAQGLISVFVDKKELIRRKSKGTHSTLTEFGFELKSKLT